LFCGNIAIGHSILSEENKLYIIKVRYLLSSCFIRNSSTGCNGYCIITLGQ